MLWCLSGTHTWRIRWNTGTVLPSPPSLVRGSYGKHHMLTPNCQCCFPAERACACSLQPASLDIEEEQATKREERSPAVRRTVVVSSCPYYTRVPSLWQLGVVPTTANGGPWQSNMSMLACTPRVAVCTNSTRVSSPRLQLPPLQDAGASQPPPNGGSASPSDQVGTTIPGRPHTHAVHFPISQSMQRSTKFTFSSPTSSSHLGSVGRAGRAQAHHNCVPWNRYVVVSVRCCAKEACVYLAGVPSFSMTCLGNPPHESAAGLGDREYFILGLGQIILKGQVYGKTCLVGYV